jgi:hypothetical protein
MITLIMAVESNSDCWDNDKPVAYTLELTPKILTVLKGDIEKAKQFKGDLRFRHIQFEDRWGKWLSEMAPDALPADQGMAITDIESNGVECQHIDTCYCSIRSDGHVSFVADTDGGCVEYYTAAALNWDWLTKEIAKLEGKLT